MASLPFLMGTRRRARRVVHYLRKLHLRDVGLLLQMFVLLMQILYLQSRLPLDELVRHFDAKKPRHIPEPVPLERLTRLVSTLMWIIYKEDYCMKRSLILFYYMRKWGYPVQIHFGVTKKEGELKGHAWVDLNQEPFAEKPDPRGVYAVTYTYPTEA